MGGGMDMFGGGGKSKIKIYGVDSKINIKFNDVAGLEQAKVEVKEFVDFLKYP